MPARVLYIIDEDWVSRNLIERLIKNEYGSFIVKHFDSCETAYLSIMEEQRFYTKEYPDFILLSGMISDQCIKRFLNGVEKIQQQISKPIQIYMMLCPETEKFQEFACSNLVKGSITKPIRPEVIFGLAESLVLQINK